MKIALTTPAAYKNGTIDEIDLDLDALTGRDMIAIEETARSMNQNLVLFSQGYFAAVAARASHLPIDVIRSLNVKDFMKVTNHVMSFLADTVSEMSEQKTSEE